MWQLAHLASGAFIGQQAQSPVLALAFGVGAHLLIDKIPHYWPKSDKQKQFFTVVDYIITLPTAYWLISSYTVNQNGIIWGVIGSLSVDILLVGVPSLHRSRLGQWHTKRQPHHTSPLYLITDAVVIALSLVMLVK